MKRLLPYSIAPFLILVNTVHAQDRVGSNSTASDDAKKEAAEQNLNFINSVQNEDALEFAYGNPTSPALALAGLKTEDVTQVNQLRDFLVSVPGLSSGQEAVAIDVNPFLLFNPIDKTNDITTRYEGNKRQAFLDKIQINALLKNGVEDKDNPEKSTKSLLSLGFSTSVLDNSNPLYNAYKGLGACESYIDVASRLLEIPERDPTHIKFEFKLSSIHLPGKFDSNQIATFDSTINQFLKETSESGKPIPKELTLIIDSVPTTKDSLFRKYDSALEYLEEKSVAKTQREKSDLVNAYDKCGSAIKRDLASKPNLDIGGAVLWRSKNSEFADFNTSGIATWVSGKKQFNLKESNDWYVAIGASGRFSFSEEVATGDETSPFGKADTFQGWTGLEVYKEKWRFAARGGYVKTNFNDSLLDDFSKEGERWLISADLLVAKNTWVSLSYGEANSLDEDLQGERFTVDLKFTQPKSIGLFK